MNSKATLLVGLFFYTLPCMEIMWICPKFTLILRWLYYQCGYAVRVNGPESLASNIKVMYLISGTELGLGACEMLFDDVKRCVHSNWDWGFNTSVAAIWPTFKCPILSRQHIFNQLTSCHVIPTLTLPGSGSDRYSDYILCFYMHTWHLIMWQWEVKG